MAGDASIGRRSGPRLRSARPGRFLPGASQSGQHHHPFDLGEALSYFGPPPTDEPIRRSRNSERASYRRCRQDWQWGYVEHLGTEDPHTALTFGTGVHHALEGYYPPGRKRGVHPAITFEKWYFEQGSAFDQWDDDGNKVDALELGIAMLNGYVEEYGGDDHLEIIAPEQVFEHHVYDKTGRYLGTWVGTGDALAVDLSKSSKKRRRVVFLEHKTTKGSIPDDVGMLSSYGEQGHSYWLGGTVLARKMGWIAEDEAVDSVEFNWLKKALPTTKPRNDDGYVVNKPSKGSLQEYLLGLPGQLYTPAGLKGVLVDELIAIVDDITGGKAYSLLGEVSKRQPAKLFGRNTLDFGDDDEQHISWRVMADFYEMDLARNGKLPITKNPRDENCRICQFREMCELHEMNSDWEAMKQFMVRRNPNDDYDKEIK